MDTLSALCMQLSYFNKNYVSFPEGKKKRKGTADLVSYLYLVSDDLSKKGGKASGDDTEEILE